MMKEEMGPAGTSNDLAGDGPTSVVGDGSKNVAGEGTTGAASNGSSREAGGSSDAKRKRAFAAGVALAGVLLIGGGLLWWFHMIEVQRAEDRQRKEEADARQPEKLERNEAEIANAMARDERVIEAASVDAAATPTPPVAPCGNLGFRCPEGFSCAPEGRCEGDGMILIPGGTFKMGCDVTSGKPCGADEVPIHTVTLTPYAIDRTEVTVDAYRRCMEAGACAKPLNTMDSRPCNVDLKGRDEYPVNCVDWERASRYCVWVDKRLPTEAEWEKAARGTDARWYSWGSEPPDCTRGNIFYKLRGCVGDTARVGGYPAGESPYGVQDMLGNVLEWVRDNYDAHYYYDAKDHDPTGPLSGDHRVLRGSSYGDTSQAGHHASARYHLPPTSAGTHIGFRCARPVP